MFKTLAWVYVTHELNKFITLGWIIFCLFDWCELQPVCEIKNHLCLRHFIVDFRLSLVHGALLQFDFAMFFLFLRSCLVQLQPHKMLSCFFFSFEGRLNFPNLCLFVKLLMLILKLIWFPFFRLVTEFSGSVVKIQSTFQVRNTHWFLLFFKALVFP